MKRNDGSWNLISGLEDKAVVAEREFVGFRVGHVFEENRYIPTLKGIRE